mmetsp:Transcript_38169/g.97498  ORF Transcript_38169/g.97498 Transcript_38169/m.97498 type:complete len:204 (-) Transcript_38169:88-699(-)
MDPSNHVIKCQCSRTQPFFVEPSGSARSAATLVPASAAPKEVALSAAAAVVVSMAVPPSVVVPPTALAVAKEVVAISLPTTSAVAMRVEMPPSACTTVVVEAPTASIVVVPASPASVVVSTSTNVVDISTIVTLVGSFSPRSPAAPLSSNTECADSRSGFGDMRRINRRVLRRPAAATADGECADGVIRVLTGGCPAIGLALL